MCAGNGNLLTTSATNTTPVVSPATALEQFQQTFSITNQSVASTILSGKILIDFSLIVKAATLIFISGVVRLFHLLRKGNQVLFIIL